MAKFVCPPEGWDHNHDDDDCECCIARRDRDMYKEKLNEARRERDAARASIRELLDGEKYLEDRAERAEADLATAEGLLRRADGFHGSAPWLDDVRAFLRRRGGEGAP